MMYSASGRKKLCLIVMCLTFSSKLLPMWEQNKHSSIPIEFSSQLSQDSASESSEILNTI